MKYIPDYTKIVLDTNILLFNIAFSSNLREEI